MRLTIALLIALAPLTTPAQPLIKNTNLIDVEGMKIKAGQTVLVTGNRIIPADKDRMYKMPEATTIIEGTNK